MRLTIRDIQKLKDEQTPIVMMTAYDANSARISEQADIPMLLVGDSLGMVVQGHDSTIPVTLDHMIYHAEIVVRVTQKPLIVGDLPFMSYTISEEQAMTNSARMMQETGVSAVKLEGGVHIVPTVKRLTQAGIPVMGHIGLTPQSVNQFGGFRVQGRELETARRLLRDALAIQEAGAFSIVLELVPKQLAAIISEKLDIPTIGIGAGVGCDGQVQVFHDVLTLAGEFLPRHAKRYVDLSTIMRDALTQYVVDVKNRQFPDDSHVFTMKDEVITTLREEFK